MKKLFTLLATFAAAVGIMQAQQVTLTWSLTEEGENQLKGVSTDANVTFTDVTPGSNILIADVYTFAKGSGTLFSPTVAINNEKGPQEGYNVVFGFQVPSNYTFKPTSLSFFSAAYASGNAHYFEATLSDNTANEKVVNQYKAGKSSENPVVTTYSFSTDNVYEGDVNLQFDLYGKSTDLSKGWIIGDLVLVGELISKSDTRENAPISWNPDEVTLKIRDKFTAPVFVNEESLPVTFSSSNEELAKVSETGVITLEEGVEGTAIITASYDGSAAGAPYKSTNVTTTIKVETNIVEETIWEDYEKVEKFEPDYMWTTDNTSGSMDAEKLLISDDHITVATVYTSNHSNYGKSYLGHEFKGAAQLTRVNAAPTEDVKTGTEQSGNSPLIVSPKEDLSLVLFMRRQAVEVRTAKVDNEEDNIVTLTHYMGVGPDESGKDSKGIFAAAHGDITTQISPEYVFGEGTIDSSGGYYAFCAAIFNLKADETYTIWSRGTTPSVNGIGYILPAKDVDVLVESIAISNNGEDVTEVATTTGSELTFTATVSPEEATVSTVTWSVSDEQLASIKVNDENPNTVTLTALAAGEVVLTATADDESNVKAEVKVTIANSTVEVTALAITGYNGAIAPETTVQLTAVVTPDDATDQEVTWTSSDETIATVDNNGLVTAVADGTVTITATSVSNPSVSATCEVVVDHTVGIIGIAADANGSFNVYDVNGRLVVKTNEAAKVLELNKGIYIINGKKTVIK